ncbi:MAG: hypothetical protein [Microviridae sp.]|nr:MAG: hypothetical protein [Microviridae sp.]
MYTKPIYKNGSLRVNNTTEGETIEQKIERIVNNKEPIKDGAPLLYTERKEGIRASTNIRTDRFEVAIEATDKIAKSYKARREERGKAPKKDGETEPTQGKDDKSSTDKKA